MIYLLCGLPGSGKTTFAKQLECDGVIRYTLDEELFKLYGSDFSPEKYQEYESATKKHILDQLGSNIKAKRAIVLDWGFWRRSEREQVKKVIQDLGAEWKLLYFKADVVALWQRVQLREQKGNHLITQKMFDDFQLNFEEPKEEREEIVHV